jgi:hypothetical protein
MYIGKEFSIVSTSSCGRYMDAVGDNLVVKTRQDTKSQKFSFDYTSRTIINVETKKSINIQNSGTSKNVNVWKTTSDWF